MTPSRNSSNAEEEEPGYRSGRSTGPRSPRSDPGAERPSRPSRRQYLSADAVVRRPRWSGPGSSTTARSPRPTSRSCAYRRAGAPVGDLAAAYPRRRNTRAVKLGTPDPRARDGRGFRSGLRRRRLPLLRHSDRPPMPILVLGGRVPGGQPLASSTTCSAMPIRWARGESWMRPTRVRAIKSFSDLRSIQMAILGAAVAPGMEPDFFPGGCQPEPSRRRRHRPADPLPSQCASPRSTAPGSGSTSARSLVKQTLHWAWIYNTDLEIPC